MKEHADERANLGNNLFRLREKANINRELLAKIAGIGTSTLFRLEMMKQRVLIETLQKVCNVYGITIDQAYHLNPDQYTSEELQSTINHFRKVHRIDVVSASTLNAKISKFQGITFYIKKMADDGHLNDYRSVSELRAILNRNYEAKFTPQEITNGLKNKKYIISQKVSRNKSLYRLKAPKPNEQKKK